MGKVKGWKIGANRSIWYKGIPKEPQNSKESHAALTLSRLKTDYNRSIPDWETPQCASDYVCLIGKAGFILFSQLFSHRDFDTPRNLIYMSYLGWYDAKFIKKSWSYQNGCVFPLFPWKEKLATWISSKLLIFNVDQLGLEPRTSRLWVC